MSVIFRASTGWMRLAPRGSIQNRLMATSTSYCSSLGSGRKFCDARMGEPADRHWPTKPKGPSAGHMHFELERLSVLNFALRHKYWDVKSATRHCVEQLRHKSDPTGFGGMAYLAEEEDDGKWEELQAVGYPKAMAKGKNKGKDEGAGTIAGKRQAGKTWHDEPD